MNTLIISSIVAVLVSFVGLRIKKIYADRVAFLEDYNSFLDELIEEISFYRSPLDTFIDRVIESKKKLFRNVLVEYRSTLYSNKYFLLRSPLKKNDELIIQTCFNSIGKCDSETELFNIKNWKSKAKSMLEISRHELKTKGELISKLMILLGLALMILLV